MDGVVVQASSLDDGLIPRLIDTGLPLVVAGQPSQTEAVSFVDVDNIKGAYLAASHLARLGHIRIATVTGPLNTAVGRNRLAGFRQALAERGVSVDAALEAEGDFTEQGGYYAMRRLLAHGPTAVFAASDIMARGAIRAVQEAGLSAPKDVAVVGYDDLPPATMGSPLLTTIRQPIRRLGAKAVETLLDIIAFGPQPARRIIFDTELIIRESCGGAALDRPVPA
jgi:LacI family transcriptional regulator